MTDSNVKKGSMKPVDFDPFADGEIASTFPATDSQREIWASVELGDEANCAYNESISLRFHGSLDIAAFTQAVQDLVSRHESLHANFSADGATYCVINNLDTKITVTDLRDHEDSLKQTRLQEYLEADVNIPFNLISGPLFRVHLVLLSENESYAIICAHHIICDGLSWAVLLPDLTHLYQAAKDKVNASLPAAERYSDYIQYISDTEHKQTCQSDLKYWLDVFSDQVPQLEFPTDGQRPKLKTYRAGRIDYAFQPEMVKQLKKLGARNGATFVVTFMAAFKIFLYRLSGQNDVVLGMMAAGQSVSGFNNLVGHCVNLLPVRSRLQGTMSFEEYLKSLRSIIFDAFDHQSVSFGTILKHLAIPRDPSRVPLCPITFNIDQAAIGYPFADLKADFITNNRRFENFELFLNAVEGEGDSLTLECTYNSDLFTDEIMLRRMQEFEHLVSQILENSQLPINALPLIPKSEQSLLNGWNKTQSPVKVGQLIHQLIEKQAVKYADKTAVICLNKHISYRELNIRANRLAHYLINNGIQNGDLVGLAVERSEQMLVAILGILKAGATYVPLDISYPSDRLNYMIENAGLCCIVTQPQLDKQFDNTIKKLHIDNIQVQSHTTDKNPELAIQDNQRAYVIYTSGSTGKPKGVEVSHSNVVNFLISMADQPGIQPDDILLAVTTLSFDIAVLELLLPLTAGATTVIAPRKYSLDGELLIESIKNNHITMMQATPSTWRLLLDSGWTGSDTMKALCGGETFPPDLAKELLPKVTSTWNMYGPTETTIWSTCHKIQSVEKTIPIGRPILNTQIHILNEAGQTMPVGVQGELYIGGAGVTRGYLNNASLTQNSFVEINSERLYRTGDLAKIHSNGEIECLGRADNQVKVRGFRIELGEIENVILNSKAIKSVVVDVKAISEADKRLVAYIIANDGMQLDAEQTKSLCRASLPEYMIPQHFVLLDEIPLTLNGKIDRKALSEFNFTDTRLSSLTKARTPTQKQLVSIWKDILHLDNVSIDENFFNLGGHSLLIAKIIHTLEQTHSVQLEYRDIFENPTIEALALDIDTKAEQASDYQTNPILPLDDSQPRTLSLAQQRLWYLDKMDPGSTFFNLPSAFRFLGAIDVSALEQTFQQMIARHQTFRTSIVEENDGPIQYVHEQIQFTLNSSDICNEQNKEKRLSQMLATMQNHIFDISEAPLFKAEIIKLSNTEYVLFFMPHHIVFDGWSFDIFVHELTTLYSQNIGLNVPALEKLSFQYTDYSVWLRDLLSSEHLHKQLDFWKDQLQGDLPVLQMPTDFPRPAIAKSTGAEIHFEIDSSLFKSLQLLASSKDVSLFMLLMTSYISLIYKYTNQTDLIIGAPMADRTRPGTENLIGFFVNALVLRFNINPQSSFVELLEQVKEICLSGFAHQDAPFETLVEELHPDRDLSRSPLFQTSLTYQDVSERESLMGDITIKQIEIPTTEAPLDINMWFKRRGEKISGGVVYNTNLFHEDTINNFIGHFNNLLSNVAQSWHQTIDQLQIISEPEKAELLSANNHTHKNWNNLDSIQALFEQQVSVTPGRTAVISGDDRITYQALSDRSNQFANALIDQGITNGQMVGLCSTRSIDMMISLLGILKAGCCYIPLDPEFPPERLAYMVKDAGIEWLVIQQSFLARIPEIKNTILIDDFIALLNDKPTTAVQKKVSGDALAYIIYTSGSTGNPKGVMVQHSAVANFLQSMSEKPGIKLSDKLLAVTTLSFDIAVLELYLPIINGACTVIASAEDIIDGHQLLDMITEHSITVIQATPSTWRLLIAAGWNKQMPVTAFCGGEALPVDLAEELVTRTHSLWNMYGPTETTVWSSCCQITNSDQPLSIGTPIANTKFYILDEQLNPVPQGIAAELHISGTGVTKGYLNNSEMTVDRFIDNPFETDSKLYKTGDLVRYRTDGSLEYISRIDDQVKVRGYRIELGEIESVLRGHDSIDDCVVSVIEERAGDARLVAHIVWIKQLVTMTELRTYCQQWLPAYMIPQHTVEISAIPKTPNGKVDRNKLPAAFSTFTQRDTYVAPDTPEQIWLADLWKQLIGTNKVSKYDNFFELGGHSLLSMQVIHMIKETSGTVLNPRELLLESLEQIALKFRLPHHGAPKKSSSGNLLSRLFNKNKN